MQDLVLDPYIMHGSLGPAQSTSQMAYRSVQLFLQGSRLQQTNRQTDIPHYSTCNNRPHLHCVPKKRPTFTTCYNFYIHSSTATIFGTNVAEKVGNQNVLYFPTSPNQCFCAPQGNRKPGNCVFSLKCCMLFHQKNTKHILKYHLVRAKPPFTVKTIAWVHQTGPRKGAQHPSVCYPHVLCQPSPSRCQLLCKKWESFFIKPGVKVNGQY